VTEWATVAAALLTGGVITAVVNYFLTRGERETTAALKEQEAAVAGLAILVQEIQEERDYFRNETHKLRQDIELLKLRMRAVENGK
jgi:hypothetical protein